MISSSSKSAWGGARANSGGVRCNSGGPRANSGGLRPGSGGKQKLSVPPPLSSDLRWHCVRTSYQGEITAAAEMGVAGFEVFCATRWLPGAAAHRDGEGTRHATVDRVEPLFPRYVLVRFALDDPKWRWIKGMEGVDHILADTPETPTPVPDEAIAWVREMCSGNGCLYPPSVSMGAIAPGADVRLRDGALASVRATYQSCGSKRVELLLRFMGRDVRATLIGTADRVEAA